MQERNSDIGIPRSAYLCGEHIWKNPALPIKQVIDSTGAGDAFVGSFAAFVASGLPIKEASRKAAKFAGISVSRPGGFDSYPEIEEI